MAGYDKGMNGNDRIFYTILISYLGALYMRSRARNGFSLFSKDRLIDANETWGKGEKS